MVWVRVGGYYYGSGSYYKCGLKYKFVWGGKQHISIGEEYIMRGWVCKSMGLFNLLVKLNCIDKYIYICIYMYLSEGGGTGILPNNLVI